MIFSIQVASLLEKEKWKRHYCKLGDLSVLRAPLDTIVNEPTLQALGTIDEGTNIQAIFIYFDYIKNTYRFLKTELPVCMLYEI